MKVVHQPAPMRIQAADAIRNEIVTGRLLPGARLIERELTEATGVSRNTLREALRQLEAEGFLEIRPHRGPIVAILSPQSAADLYEVREALECMAVRLFTLRASDSVLEGLQRDYESFAVAVEADDTSNVVSVKDAFYDRLYAGTGNAELHAQARTLYGRIASLRIRSLSTPGRPGESLLEMRQVIETMKARDADGAADLWREHIHHAAHAALRALKASQPPD